MRTLSNPTEIAREAFRQLAVRRVPPTPDNYRIIYGEVAGHPMPEDFFPEKALRQIASEIGRVSPEQRLGRDLDEAIKHKSWPQLRKTLTDHIALLSESQQLAWANLINNLLRQWDEKTAGLTTGKKRESLEHVLSSAGSNQRLLFNRLENLLHAWSQGQASEDLHLVDAPPTHQSAPENGPTITSTTLLGELRELFAQAVETCITPQLARNPQLVSDSTELAGQIRKSTSLPQLQEIQTRLKRLSFKLALQIEDDEELRNSLLNLLRLIADNITEMLIDDQWLQGQMDTVRSIVNRPLSQQAIDDVEQRLKEVIFKQSQLKLSLQEAKNALKTMLAGFVDHLADFAGATSSYHDKIERCAEKISAANHINELEAVLAEVLQETRTIQFNALRSRDELQLTQQQVKDAEARILQLEKELAETSELVRHDQLTGVLNRRGLEELLDKEIARARRHGTPFCLALLDIDNFKKLNDSFGHDTGDAALVHMTQVVKEALRPQDTVGRQGGEEFLILLPNCDAQQAASAITRVQRELTRRIFMHDNQKLLITFSAGVAELTDRDTHGSLIKRADQSMYHAKQTGKNKVVTDHSSPPENHP